MNMDDRAASPYLSFDGIARSVALAVFRLLHVPFAVLFRVAESGAVSIVSASDASPPIEPAAAHTFLQASRESRGIVILDDVSRRHGGMAEAAQALGIASL